MIDPGVACIAALLAAAPTSAPRELDPIQLAGDIVGSLEKDGFGFPSGAAIAVSVRARDLVSPLNGRASTWVQRMSRALRVHLEAAGGVFISWNQDEGPKSARLAGAEWLLEVLLSAESGALVIEADLIEIDQGVWRTSTTPAPLHGFARIERGLKGPEIPPIGSPSDAADAPQDLRLGEPIHLLRWPRRVLGLALCPVPRGEIDRLIVLETKRVVVLDLNQGRVRTIGALDLSTWQERERPVRAPFGTVRCGPPGVAAFGHGRLFQGAEFSFTQGVQVIRRLPGMAIGWDGEGWWLGQPDRGRRRFSRTIQHTEGPSIKTETPQYELWLDERSLLGVGPDLSLRPLTDSGALGLPLTAAGVALSARRMASGYPWILSSSPYSDREWIRLMVGSEESLRGLEAPLSAAALGRPRGRRWAAVVALDHREDGHRIMLVPVEGTP